MLGWQVIISKSGDTLCSWSTGIGGLAWLDELVKEGKAEDQGGNGYPNLYSAKAKEILTVLSEGAPKYSGPTVIGDDYIRIGGLNDAIKIDRSKLNNCSPDDQLTIEAWDQS
jgi:hypothetical protein